MCVHAWSFSTMHLPCCPPQSRMLYLASMVLLLAFHISMSFVLYPACCRTMLPHCPFPFNHHHLSLQGWKLAQGSAPQHSCEVQPGSTVIPPGGYALVYVSGAHVCGECGHTSP